ncbi:hypothetical protein ACOSP7_009624 [Xanthoceras sorbifolium]
MGLKIDYMELDSSNVVADVKPTKRNEGVAGVLLDDEKTLCREVGALKCQAISRFWNGVAHALPSLAFSSFEEQSWLDDKSSCVVSFLYRLK